MSFGVAGRVRALALVLVALCGVAGCSGQSALRQYEYEEELYLALDGSVIANVNASVASLVALRGIDLNPDPRARIDREQVRALFEGPGTRTTVSLGRRDLRRFVHVSVRADTVESLSKLQPFAWSSYRFERSGDVFRFRQVVGPPSPAHRGGVRWTGTELVAFRLHLPSEIVFHNAPTGRVERGNILEWEQSLSDRLAGRPVDMQVDLEPESILQTTLILFGSTVVAALSTLLFVVWWIARRGRAQETGRPPAS